MQPKENWIKSLFNWKKNAAAAAAEARRQNPIKFSLKIFLLFIIRWRF